MTEVRSPAGLAVATRPPLDPSADPAALPYLLVHGSMDRASSFRRLAARLPEAAVISYDRRGYAGSVDVTPSLEFAAQVDDLLEAVDGRAVVALGHSFGGGVVLAAAAARPDLLRAAVVWEPPMPWLPDWPTTTAGAGVVADTRSEADVAESFMRRMVGDRIWEKLPPSTRTARRAEGGALVAEMRSLRGRQPWDPGAVSVPVIVGTGGRSRDHQRRAAGQLTTLLPHAELVVVADTDHGAHLSRPGELAGLLRRAASLAGVGPMVGTGAATGAECKAAAIEESPS